MSQSKAQLVDDVKPSLAIGYGTSNSAVTAESGVQLQLHSNEHAQLKLSADRGNHGSESYEARVKFASDGNLEYSAIRLGNYGNYWSNGTNNDNALIISTTADSIYGAIVFETGTTDVSSGELWNRDVITERVRITNSGLEILGGIHGSGATQERYRVTLSSTMGLNTGDNNNAAVRTAGLNVGGTAYLKVPIGTTAQRPATGTAGMLRFNSTLSKLEQHDGTSWGDLGGGGGAAVGGATGVDFNDNVKVRYGDDNDIEQFFDGTRFTIKPKTTSTTSQLDFEAKDQVYIESLSNGIFLRASNQSIIDMYGGSGGGIYFHHNGNDKLKLEGGNWTTQGDADWTFSGTNYNVVFDASDDSLRFNDNARAKFGTGNDLEFYHDGTTARLITSDNFYVRAPQLIVLNSGGSQNIAIFDDSNGVKLYHNSDKKIETTSSGVTVTGTYKDTIYSLTGTAIDPANGGIQTKTISANTTFTESLSEGDGVILHLGGAGSYTITWPTITWVTSSGNTAPTFTANDVVVLWKISTTLYGAYAGSYA